MYNTDLVGQSQPSKKPFHWVAIKLDDKSPIVVLEVNENKDFTEIVGWYTLDERNLGRIKRQAIKNGGELVMLSLKDKVESLSTPNDDLSTHKDTPSTPNSQANKSKSNVAKKDKAITTSDLFPKVDNSKKLGKEISRQSAVTDKNVTLTRIDYENGYVCRVENKNGDFVEQAYNADGTPMSQALYNIGVDNNQFKEFIKQDKNGLYIKDEQLFEVLMQNTEKENAKPKSDTKKSVPKNKENAPKNEESVPKNEESVPKTKKSLRQHKAEQAQAATTEDTARRDALTDLMQQSGMEVFVDEKAQQVLDEVNGRGAQVRLQAKLSALSKAAKLIHNWIANKVQGRIFTIELPEATRRMIRNVMGRDFDSHNITINGIRHGLKNHGVEGKKLNANSVPIREEDAELIPYIMTAPDYVRKGSEDVTGRESIRFYKTLSNGFVVVVEKEYKNSPNDMETINIWAEMSSEATNAQRRAVPDTNVQNAILSTDAAKIRKDAEDAIRKEEKLREHRVFHGSGAEFDAFDHSHMGEGEGAQAYGWGTYVTEVEGIGQAYASTSGEVIAVKYVGNKNIPAILQGAIEHKMMETGSLSWCREDWRDMLDFCMENINEAKKENREPKLSHLSMANKLEELLAVTEDMKDDDFKMESKRFLYTVEIPEDNGTNYLHWEKPLTREQIVRITEKWKSGGWNVVAGNHPTFEKNGERIVLNERAQGQDVYTELEEAFGSDKAASEFLASIGFIGISYPAEYRSGGRNDGARNFVIFNESDAQITDHIRFFRTPGGEAYGFTVNGKIYLDPRIATAETAIHEYAHLWADMLRQMNPEAWNDIVQLMKGTSVWDEVKSLYPELKTDDEIADEVLAHYSGRQGAAKLREEHHRIAHDQNMDLRSKATAIAALERIKQALTKFWKGVADLLHIRFTTAEEVADRVLADLLHGVTPTAYAKREDGKGRKQLIGEKGAAAIDKAESSNGAVLYREDSENSNHPYEVFTGNEAIEQLDGVLNDDTILLPDLPMPIRSLTEFQRVFAQPVRSAIGEYLNIKDDVYNKIIRENRSAISGALLPTIQNPDFVIRDVDGSNLYVKRFVSANSGNKYNIVAVNKHGEIEDYVSSVHVKRDNNIRNKIKNGAELLLPNERNTDGINIRNNSTPAANVIQSPNTSNTLQRENAENNANAATEAPITQAANRTAESLHLDNVTILSEEDLASLTPKQQRAKGWFDPKTGRIYINASNHANEADVVQTVLHEAVAHFGLRALFGKDFDTMLDRVYRAADSEIHIPTHPIRVQQPGTANNRHLRQNHLRPQCQGRKTHRGATSRRT